MKKHYKLALILGVLAFAIVACNRDDDGVNAPDLIEPEDGAVFSSEPPTFIWSSQPFADGYTIVINDDSSMTGDTVLSEDLYDTSYTMPASDFEGLENGTYYWTAAAYDDPADGSTRLYYWDEVRSFMVEEPVPFDLDTTYFPFGMDYEWVYEVHRWGHKSWNYDGSDPYEEWNYYDTVTIRITDSVVTAEGWTFTVDGGRFFDVNYYDDKARIRGEEIEIFGWEEIELEPEPTGTSMPGDGIGIVYEEDTLYMGFLFDMYSDEHHNEERDDFTWRIKGIGVVKQEARYYDWDMRMGMQKSDLGMSEYELLSFSKGNKTVWRR